MKTYTKEEVQFWRDDIAQAAADIAERFGLDLNAVDNIRQLAKKPVTENEPVKYEARLIHSNGNKSEWIGCRKQMFDNAPEGFEVRALYDHPPVECKDDPFMDGTDFAHPAWHRGVDYSYQIFCGKVEEILDGKDAGEGTSREPWHTIRQRLVTLVKKVKDL